MLTARYRSSLLSKCWYLFNCFSPTRYHSYGATENAGMENAGPENTGTSCVWVARRNIINVVRGRRADINMVLRLFWHFGVNSYQLAELSGPWIMTLRISFYAWLQLCFNFWCHLRLCIQLCQSTTVSSLDWSVFLSVHYTLILIHFAFHRRWSCFFHRCEIWSRVFQFCLFHPRIFHGPALSIPAFSASHDYNNKKKA